MILKSFSVDIMMNKGHFIRKFRVRLLVVSAMLCTIYCILNEDLESAEMVLDGESRLLKIELQEALKEDKGTGCEIPHLDPFAKEVIQFDKDLPKVVCDGRDWVKCYLHECRVVKEILATTKRIKCEFRDILRKDDDKYTIGRPTTIFDSTPYILTVSDHVKIKCTGQHLNRPSSWTGHGVGYRSEVSQPPTGTGGPYDILILGFDSTSKNGFVRKMPKSYRYLTGELSATVLNGYNIVGDGTLAALLPILTGRTELELPDVRKFLSTQYLDGIPFIFNKLKKHGYRTAYFEDTPKTGTFQYRLNGFKRQPADHYLRTFFLEEEKSALQEGYFRTTDKYCVGDTPRFKLMLNITEQFFKLPGSHFGFTFIADITHDDFNVISTADDDIVSFLQEFRRKGHLDKTILIVMGDHGVRFADVRSTLQGKLEERLPLMAIHLPRALTEARPGILANLVSNADALTTPHDIHATILDALHMTQYRNLYKIQGADLYRGLTLFESMPRTRSCSEAGIEPHWCACLTWQNVSQQEPIYSKAGKAIVEFINSVTERHRAQCALRTLLRTEWVLRSRANNRLLAYKGGKDRDHYVGDFNGTTTRTTDKYQIKVAVGPGQSIYEGTATYIIKKDKFVFDVKDISRTNAYKDEPSCVSTIYPHLNKYCYCHKRFTMVTIEHT